MAQPSNIVFQFKSSEGARSLGDGDVIFREGEPGDLMYGVQSGAVDLLVGGRTVETVKEGGVFGEMALIDHAPRSATAVARGATTIVEIDEDRFRFLTQHTPNFALNVLKVLSRRLRMTNIAAG